MGDEPLLLAGERLGIDLRAGLGESERNQLRELMRSRALFGLRSEMNPMAPELSRRYGGIQPEVTHEDGLRPA